MAYQTFTMFSGDDKRLTISVTDSAGDAVDVTGASITYVIAAQRGGTALVTKTVGNGISIDGSTVTVTLDGDDTADLAGRYWHELEIIDNGGQVSTALHGAVIIRQDSIK